MPHERLYVPPPDEREELRLWAEAIADLHDVVGKIAEHAQLVVPGEHVEGFRAAWETSNASFERVVVALSPPRRGVTPEGKVSGENLAHAHLDGKPGALKRSILARLRDAFLGYFVSEPRSEERLRLAADAGARYSDAGAVILGSLGACASEVPGFGAACKVGEEGLLGVKQLLEMRPAEVLGSVSKPDRGATSNP